METMMSTVRPATLDDAKSIFARGIDYLGPEEIIRVHGKLHGLQLPKELPSFPWSAEELHAARQQDLHLILVSPGLTIQKLCDARNNLGADGGKLLHDSDLDKEEKFFTKETTGEDWDWRLATNAVIPDSVSQNYVEQTTSLVRHLTEVVFAGRDLPAVYTRAIAEFEKQKEALTKLIETDWEEAAKQLAALAINRLLRETPVLTFYRLVTYLSVNGERLLPETYHWSPSLSSHGKLVGLGLFDRLGVLVNGWRPRGRHGVLGVVLSRSAKVEMAGVE